jgi:nitrogen fixation protein NifB
MSDTVKKTEKQIRNKGEQVFSMACENHVSSRPYAAVTSTEGFLVNQHLGHAAKMYIYGFESHELKLIEIRTTPPTGGGDMRWKQLAEVIKDCQALFTNQAGTAPTKVLESCGIRVIQKEGFVEQLLPHFFERKSARLNNCQSECSNMSSGCDCDYDYGCD